MPSAPALHDQLFGPFAAIHEQHPDCQVASYYDGVFFEYEKHAPAPQTWDLAVYDTWLERTNARSVLDLGCGAGRITTHLVQRPEVERVVGVDNSPAAQAAFHESLGANPKTHFLRDDLVHPTVSTDHADLAILGNLNINCFLDPDTVRSVFTGVTPRLAPGGHLLVLVFAAEVSQNFPRSGMDAVSFTDADQRTRLIWRAMEYHPETSILQRNYFIEGRDGERIPFPGILGTCQERIWTAEEIIAIADQAGYSQVAATSHSLEGGNADGWQCEAVLFAPQATADM